MTDWAPERTPRPHQPGWMDRPFGQFAAISAITAAVMAAATFPWLLAMAGAAWLGWYPVP